MIIEKAHILQLDEASRTYTTIKLRRGVFVWKSY